MKAHALLVLSLFAFNLPAFAQRESFDATIVKRATIMITEIEVHTTEEKESVPRNGRTHDGKDQSIKGSKQAITFDNIFFKLDSTELRDDTSREQVSEIAKAMKSPKWKNLSFLVEGHTCDLADDAYNLDLSARRAETIRQMLIKQGIAAERLAALGFGEREIVDPVKSGDSPATAERKRMKSRRVVLRQIIRP